jgi:Flp pilus assembly protein TadD
MASAMHEALPSSFLWVVPNGILRGPDPFCQRTRCTTEGAVEMFGQAVERDPAFALAHAWHGHSCAVYVFNHAGAPAQLDPALESARRAVALQPDLAGGRGALGTALMASGRYGQAGTGCSGPSS